MGALKLWGCSCVGVISHRCIPKTRQLLRQVIQGVPAHLAGEINFFILCLGAFGLVWASVVLRDDIGDPIFHLKHTLCICYQHSNY
jgi:hypothetical protein